MRYIDIIGIGMGFRDISLFHMKLVNDADLLIGGSRQLALFPEYAGQTYTITKDIPGLVKKIQDELPTCKIAVLASGDPLFFGIGTTLSRHLLPDQVRIHPNVSSLCAGFAKIGHPWQDTKVVSLHSGQADPDLLQDIFNNDKLFFLTSPSRGPAFIAEQLKRSGKTGFRFCVLENLGHDTLEKKTWFSDHGAIIQETFSNPNVVILIRTQPKASHPKTIVSHETHLGLPENKFYHTKGLITKSEIRVLSLSKLQLTRQDHIIWDIGSGSGSMSIEASAMAPKGRVLAIEKQATRIKDIKQNIACFKRTNIFVHQMTFPDGIKDLEPPDRIFIGGGGKTLKQIIQSAADILLPKGVIVVNTVVIDSMACAMETLSCLGLSPELTHVQISRSSRIAGGSRLSPLNPVWIISGVKPMKR